MLSVNANAEEQLVDFVTARVALEEIGDLTTAEKFAAAHLEGLGQGGRSLPRRKGRAIVLNVSEQHYVARARPRQVKHVKVIKWP